MSDAVLVTAMLVFTRLGALLYSMPVLGAKGVPKHVPVLLSLLMTLLMAPAVDIVTGEITVPYLMAAIGGEIAIGMSMGLILSAVFAAMSFSTEAMSMQTGLGMASLFDPLQQTTTGTLGVLASWLAGLVFLGLGLHLHVLEIVAASFAYLPPGTSGLPEEGAPQVIEAVGITIHLGVQLAAPILAFVWLVNVFVATLAKLAPRMNVFFSIGLTLTSVGGIALLAFSLPWVIEAHTNEMRQAVLLVEQFLGSF